LCGVAIIRKIKNDQKKTKKKGKTHERADSSSASIMEKKEIKIK
jgi:hypothetical protein